MHMSELPVEGGEPLSMSEWKAQANGYLPRWIHSRQAVRLPQKSRRQSLVMEHHETWMDPFRGDRRRNRRNAVHIQDDGYHDKHRKNATQTKQPTDLGIHASLFPLLPGARASRALDIV